MTLEAERTPRGDDEDGLTDWQRRNRRWLAEHRAMVTVVGVTVFGLMGLGLRDAWHEKVDWLSRGAVVTIFALIGAGLGWCFSVENSGHQSRAQRVLMGLVVVAAVLVIVGMKLLRHVD